MKKIPVKEHTLSNGLRVVLSESHEVPTVAVAIYYDVGSRNEKVGRTGFAHLFEHMMFEGSKNVPKTMHMKFISSAGGSMNGSTSEERTNYFESLPSHMLPLALWLEADRMRSLKITIENFENQRETVKEERRQSIDNRPYGEAWIKLRETAIENWPYSHPVIGSMEDLDSAHVEDAQAFFSTYYAPNNAVLSIAGDFNTDTTISLIEDLFGDIPSSNPPDPVDVDESEQTAEKLITITDPKIALPAVVIAYHVPHRRHPDTYPAVILKQILIEGKSSRLYKRIVEDEQAAIECFGYIEQTRGPAIFPIWFIATDSDTARLKTIIDEEISKIIENGITERELQKAKNIIKSDFISRMQTSLGRALATAEFKIYDNDPGLINTELNRYLEVTREDVERVAQKYLAQSNRTILDVIPGSQSAQRKQEEV